MNAHPFSPVEAAAVRGFSPEPGLIRRVLAHNDKLMLVEHHAEGGWVGAAHSHPHDQLVYVVKGRLHVVVGETRFEARAGDSFVVPGGVTHQASAQEVSIMLDVFTPARAEYRPEPRR